MLSKNPEATKMNCAKNCKDIAGELKVLFDLIPCTTPKKTHNKRSELSKLSPEMQHTIGNVISEYELANKKIDLLFTSLFRREAPRSIDKLSDKVDFFLKLI